MVAHKLKNKTQSTAAMLEVSQAPSYDNNPFWQSTLFSDVYLRNDVPNKYRDIWEQDSSGKFYEFCERFREFCSEMQGETFENWTERTTINRFIKPVLKLLGWSPLQQESWIEDESFSINESGETKTYKPDFVIVHDPKQLKYIERESGAKKTNAAREESIISIEAKYWGRIDESKYSNREDKGRADKKDQVDSTKAMDFDEQCLKYVEILHHDYGILTDGRTWRLFHKELSSGTFKRCYQFNLGKLIKHVNAGLDEKSADYLTFVDNVKYFYHLFSKSALYNPDGRRFVDELISDSRKYSDQIEEDLKLRFVSAMTIACNGFRVAMGKTYSSKNIELIRSTAESHIFTILFVRYCESRNILPIRQNPDYKLISLSNMIDKLDLFNPDKESDDLNTPVLQRRFRDQFEYSPDGTDLHNALLNIVDILQNGFDHHAAKFSIAGFKETVFSAEELSFTKKYKITNRDFAKLLFELTYLENETTGKSQQIAYSFFAPRQLGSIYESFLEYRLDEAEADLAFIKKKWIAADINSTKITKMKVPTVKKGRLFFTPDNAERKATGSYYTPDCVVQFILDKALKHSIQGKTSKQLLSMRICDPAMGSGHFLSGALDYLAKKYVQKLDDESTGDVDLSLLDAKRTILQHCIFGVDINPRAVKLAKMSLWLESAAANKPLEPLDDQIKCANSLVDHDLWFKEWQAGKRGFDAVIGNPPYLGEKGHKEIFQNIAKGWLGERFYLGKMDIFYFFFHLALDILDSNGVVGFITTNYYPTAAGAHLLRRDLKDRASIELLLNLNAVRVFGDAAGQHNLITIARNGSSNSKCAISIAQSTEKVSSILLSSLVDEHSSSLRLISQKELYDGENLYIRSSSGVSSSAGDCLSGALDKLKAAGFALGDQFEVSTGIQTGADKISQKHIDKFKLKDEKGAGIFVLSTEELKALGLKGAELNIMKPWFKNSDITPFSTSTKPREFLIYLDKRQVAFKSLPGTLKRHIDRFETVISNSVCNPPYLHRPRDATMFLGEKIVVPQRSKMNTFGYNDQPWYASCDVYFITRKKTSSVGLKYVLGLLNSKLYFAWFYLRGKRKGECLELYQTPLSEAPIIVFDETSVKSIESYVCQLISNNEDLSAFEKMNQLIFKNCKLTVEEINHVTALYDSRFLSNDLVSNSENADDDEAA